MTFNKTATSIGYGILLILIFGMQNGCSKSDEMGDIRAAGRSAMIEPDYAGIIIPSNIAPLNFVVKESAQEYTVRIYSRQGDTIRIHSGSGAIQIPPGPWKRLLAENIGGELIVELSIKNQDGEWIRFDSIVNHIAPEQMDGYLTYRKFGPLFNIWKKMGIYQRSLETFEEKPVFLNRLAKDGCVNCHNFWQNGTDRWLLHLRGGPGTGMLLVIDGKVRKINTKTQFNAPAAYPSWHPSGSLIAFSVNNLLQFFHATGECRDVLDRYSDIIIYDIPTNTITTVPQISNPERLEIWPAWSPDGKALYFCSAPKIETFLNPAQPDEFEYNKIKYDLMRVTYDPATRSWGELETVISSADLGLSITEPRVSPDGHFLLFTAAEYSQFPIYLRSADLYLLDLRTGKWKKLEVNSDRADSFHSWSSNSRWIVFSTKRMDGLFARPYFSHIDSLGIPSKPFVLPQENPAFYETCLQTFNVPEFTREPIRMDPQVLAKAAFFEQEVVNAKLDPGVISSRNVEKAKPDQKITTPSNPKNRTTR
jgi:hypothetical protein